ncbi:hypothetical protein TNIN_405491 [Trichonephila inaurata madagascariensis]|uniref:Uncharacterized protein n=1 Tax=Trichonephila inaurata madagascariensis TaxID=2747483 RepID=A0A8X7CN91_9ARAC|nr:hypothetical protein TNIN_405491 [Trichonephila inaurata madagascariensis]
MSCFPPSLSGASGPEWSCYSPAAGLICFPPAAEFSVSKIYRGIAFPDGVFPIGDDVFVFASTYYDSVSVHIRRFKKYGKTYYPTPEGITLDPRWIEYIMRKKKVPESLEDLPSGLFPPERHIQITIENFTDFTFKRI